MITKDEYGFGEMRERRGLQEVDGSDSREARYQKAVIVLVSKNGLF